MLEAIRPGVKARALTTVVVDTIKGAVYNELDWIGSDLIMINIKGSWRRERRDRKVPIGGVVDERSRSTDSDVDSNRSRIVASWNICTMLP